MLSYCCLQSAKYLVYMCSVLVLTVVFDTRPGCVELVCICLSAESRRPHGRRAEPSS